MIYCKKCVYPKAAVNLIIDNDGIAQVANHSHNLIKLVTNIGKRKKINYKI